MNPAVTIEDHLRDLIEVSVEIAICASVYDDTSFDPHCRALTDILTVFDAGVSDVDWDGLNEAITPVRTPNGGHRIWTSPRTQHCLDHITPDWGTPTRNLIDLATMVVADQRHLAEHLIHPDDAARSLGTTIPEVLRMTRQGRLSSIDIAGVVFIVDDEHLDGVKQSRGAHR